jgi:hypothetical protein
MAQEEAGMVIVEVAVEVVVVVTAECGHTLGIPTVQERGEEGAEIRVTHPSPTLIQTPVAAEPTTSAEVVANASLCPTAQCSRVAKWGEDYVPMS